VHIYDIDLLQLGRVTVEVKFTMTDFDVSLTVHFSITLDIDQLNAQAF
jgi:hypothetical protein